MTPPSSMPASLSVPRPPSTCSPCTRTKESPWPPPSCAWSCRATSATRADNRVSSTNAASSTCGPASFGVPMGKHRRLQWSRTTGAWPSAPAPAPAAPPPPKPAAPRACPAACGTAAGTGCCALRAILGSSATACSPGRAPPAMGCGSAISAAAPAACALRPSCRPSAAPARARRPCTASSAAASSRARACAASFSTRWRSMRSACSRLSSSRCRRAAPGTASVCSVKTSSMRAPDLLAAAPGSTMPLSRSVRLSSRSWPA
mmetsp:Transcript_120345/g.376492  ORF Transcript_120345/g.376492 Transcript_120345/m.376492 type:complete len:261 (-) Transcript_120345:255-1037(-)